MNRPDVSVRPKLNVKTIGRKDAIVFVLRSISRMLLLKEMEIYIRKGVIDNEWITSFTVESLNPNNQIEQEIVVSIDWDTYRGKLATKQGEITIDPRKGVIEEISPEFLRFLSMFKSIAASHPTWRSSLSFTYAAASAAKARAEFKTSPRGKQEYAPGCFAQKAEFGPLSEMSSTVRLGMSASPSTSSKTYVGVVEHQTPHFGFIRPDGWLEDRSFWYPIAAAPRGLQKGDRVEFTGFVNESGRYEAKQIRTSGQGVGKRHASSDRW